MLACAIQTVGLIYISEWRFFLKAAISTHPALSRRRLKKGRDTRGLLVQPQATARVICLALIETIYMYT